MGLSELLSSGGKGGWVKKPPFFTSVYTYPTMMKISAVIPYLKNIKKNI